MRIIPFALYLTRSKIRADLLTLFFLNLNRSYYLHELARRLGYSPGSLSRELKAFSKDGLLEREARGREIFYRVHRSHPLFHEIKGIVEKTAGIPKRLSQGLQSIGEIQEAYLYGSFVKGRMEAHSDIDLLLVGHETERSKKLIRRLEEKFDRPINAVFYSQEEFESKKDNKSEFLYEVMRSPLIRLKPHGEKAWI